MLVLAGFLVGGVIAFVRSRSWLPALMLGSVAVFCGVVAVQWAPR